MNKTALALTTALLLAGGAVTTASAQTTYYYDDGGTYTTYSYNDDADRDGVPNQDDRYDNRYDSRYENHTEYDRYGRPIVARDRDCDGVPDRYDSYSRDMGDSDCDGVSDRYDETYNGSGTTPYNYRHVRWSVGSYLPESLYGHFKYIDNETYGLRAPPPGFRWDRVGKDAYLVSIHNGLIADAIYNRFH